MQAPSLKRLLLRFLVIQSTVWLVAGSLVAVFLVHFVHQEDVVLRHEVEKQQRTVSETAARQLLLLDSAQGAGELLDQLDEIEYELWRTWQGHNKDILWVRLCDVSENVLAAMSSPALRSVDRPPLPAVRGTEEKPLGSLPETETVTFETKDPRNPKREVVVRRWPVVAWHHQRLHTVAVLELGFSGGVAPFDAFLHDTGELWLFTAEGRCEAFPDGRLLSFFKKTNELENSLNVICRNNANLGLTFIDVRNRPGSLVAGTTSGAFWEPRSEEERLTRLERLGASNVHEMSIAHRGFVRGTMKSGWSASRGGSGGMSPLLERRMRRLDIICVTAFVVAFAVSFLVQAVLLYIEMGQVSRPLRQLAENMRRFTTPRGPSAANAPATENGRVDATYVEIESLANHFAEMQRQVQEMLQAKEEANRELEKTQRARRQRARLATLGELGASLAHEVNNKLNPSRLRIQDLLMDLERGGTVQKEDVLFLLGQVDEIAQFVRRFKGFARPDLQAPEALDLNEVVENSISLLRRQLETSSVLIETELDALPKVLGDAVELEQVLMNLFLNARDAIEPTITGAKSHGTVRVRCWQEAGKACLSVADDGAGMDDEVRQRIFMPFFTTKGVEGTGLGLAISQEILRRHRAEVDVESAPGKGTTFTIRFPAASAGERSPAEPMKDSLLDPMKDSLITWRKRRH